jgi:hypothetical protein
MMGEHRNFDCPVTEEPCSRAECRHDRCLDQVEANAAKAAETLARDQRKQNTNDLYSLFDKPPMKD